MHGGGGLTSCKQLTQEDGPPPRSAFFPRCMSAQPSDRHHLMYSWYWEPVAAQYAILRT
jgi:hypothetical protein